MSESSDWLGALKQHVDKADAEFELAQLQPGDRLEVVTGHTTYRLRMLGEREADLETGRADRPSGRVYVQGCAFGASRTIKPGHIFCGGSLEFTFRSNENLMEHRTSPIREIRHFRAGTGGHAA